MSGWTVDFLESAEDAIGVQDPARLLACVDSACFHIHPDVSFFDYSPHVASPAFVISQHIALHPAYLLSVARYAFSAYGAIKDAESRVEPAQAILVMGEALSLSNEASSLRAARQCATLIFNEVCDDKRIRRQFDEAGIKQASISPLFMSFAERYRALGLVSYAVTTLADTLLSQGPKHDPLGYQMALDFVRSSNTPIRITDRGKYNFDKAIRQWQLEFTAVKSSLPDPPANIEPDIRLVRPEGKFYSFPEKDEAAAFTAKHIIRSPTFRENMGLSSPTCVR